MGYDTFWLTEHHLAYDGYEVTPNLILILFRVHLAGLTRRLRLGPLCDVVSQWHLLRLAEDFAMADVLTGVRLVLGVGRGTVPREAQSFGAAWSQQQFYFSGRHYTFPPPGIPDHGATVTRLTLVPRRVSAPVEIFQPVSSEPPTFDPGRAHGHELTGRDLPGPLDGRQLGSRDPDGIEHGTRRHVARCPGTGGCQPVNLLAVVGRGLSRREAGAVRGS